MKSNYKRIGDYVTQIKLKNIDNTITDLKGIKINKQFMPSVANINGTDLSKYRVVKKDQFAFNPMHVGRDEVLPIAMLESESPIIVSPAYVVFEVKDENELLPAYLMMWCRRSEFDRNAWFMTDNSVRGGFSWSDFCDMELPIPSIDKQREIVREYNMVNDRIKLNKTLIQKLEDTAQAIYKQWFVDFEFPISKEYAESIGKPELEGKPYKSSGGEMEYCEELEQDIPVDWSLVSIAQFCKDMKNGSTPKRDQAEYWDSKDIPWIKTGEVKNNILINAEEYISHLGHKNSSTQLLPENTVLMALYGATASQLGILKFSATTNQACCGMICHSKEDSAYLYYRLLHEQAEIKSMAIGGAQENLSKTLIETFLIFDPLKQMWLKNYFDVIIDNKRVAKEREETLRKLRVLLLCSMTKLD